MVYKCHRVLKLLKYGVKFNHRYNYCKHCQFPEIGVMPNIPFTITFAQRSTMCLVTANCRSVTTSVRTFLCWTPHAPWTSACGNVWYSHHQALPVSVPKPLGSLYPRKDSGPSHIYLRTRKGDL